MSNITNFTNVVGKSIRKINSVSAADEELTYISNNQDCTFLPGAVCDMYGLPIPTSDYSTIDVSPDDPNYVATISPNLDSDGKIREGSELAKFINFCSNRQSPWGVKDANILNALQTDFGIVGNNLPVVNDIVDVVNAAEDVANEGWATGSTCMNSESNPRWDSEFKYYQRYIEDMRILASMEGNDTSSASANGGLNNDLVQDNISSTEPATTSNPVLAYLQEYDATHPEDNSFEGILARISGQTKDDVAMMLEFVDYSTKIANYDPSTRYIFGQNKTAETQLSFEDEKLPNIAATIRNTDRIFIDRRNYIL